MSFSHYITRAELLALMDGHEPPVRIPADKKTKLTAAEVKTALSYWEVFDSRLSEAFPDRPPICRWIAGLLAEPWGSEDLKRSSLGAGSK